MRVPMPRKLWLPVTRASNEDESAPTVDAVRRRLGGRASSEGRAGELVALSDAADGEHLGVVLFARDDELAVWVGEGLVRKTRRALTRTATCATPPALAKIADDARVFGSLAEGQRVTFEASPGELTQGTLVEKCRFGALVKLESGTLVGVGFRRIWPMAEARGDN